MFRARVKSIPEDKSSIWLRSHKIGDIVVLNDVAFGYFKEHLEVIKHYRVVYVKKKCRLCGHKTNIKVKEFEL